MRQLGEAGRAWEEVAAGLDAGEAERLAEVKQRLATVYDLEGASPRAAAVRLEAADAFEAIGLNAKAAGELLLAADELWRDEVAANRILDRALEAARRADSSELESRCLSTQGFIAGRAGRRDEGLDLMRSALSLALEGNHVDAAVTAYWTLGATANDWADYARAPDRSSTTCSCTAGRTISRRASSSASAASSSCSETRASGRARSRWRATSSTVPRSPS